ncbi:MAG TPA: hypothetical protein VMI75_26320 [Polyangiaceae bacterium]|nr:hypothetical protein [Polyangiaceae bacterium]
MRSHFSLLAFGLFVPSVVACGNGQSQNHSSGIGPDASTGSDASKVGSPTDGGVSDGNTADVPLGEGGASLCNDGGAFLFCDGFEDTNLSDNWSQTQYANAPPPQADSVHYYRGTHALHARTYAVVDAGAAAYSTIQKLASSGSWPAHFFTRLFVYQPSPSPPSPEGLLDLINTTSPYAGIELISNPLGPSGGLATFTYNTSTDQGWPSDAGLALDQWVCFEVEVDTFNSVSHVYMNGVEVTALAGMKLGLPALGNVSVGMSFFSPIAGQKEEDSWIDEVAVSTSRIGCSN